MVAFAGRFSVVVILASAHGAFAQSFNQPTEPKVKTSNLKTRRTVETPAVRNHNDLQTVCRHRCVRRSRLPN